MFYKETATIATLLVMTSSLIHHYLSWAFQQKDFTWATTFTWGEVILQSMSAGHMKGDWSYFTILHCNVYVCQSTTTDLVIGIFDIIRACLSKFISAHYGFSGINTFAVYCSCVITLHSVFILGIQLDILQLYTKLI